jgi:hypothetical protein
MEENAKQWQWLENDLKKVGADNKIYIYMHYPLFLNDPQTDQSETNYEVINKSDRIKLLDMFKQYGVDVVFTGHTHWPIHNYTSDMEFHSLYSGTFTRVFWPSDFKPFYKGGGAWRFSPYKAGYYIVRVYPDKTVTQFVQSYPEMPKTEECQKENGFIEHRIIPQSAAEKGDSYIGINFDLPEIVHWKDTKGDSNRDYTVCQPIEMPAQNGVKWMRIKQAFISAEWSEKRTAELNRLLSFGIPRGVKMVLPLAVNQQQVSEIDFSQFKDKIAAYQVLDTNNGKIYSTDAYIKIVEAVAKQLKEQSIDAKIIIGGFPVDAIDRIEQVYSQLHNKPDVVILNADINNMSEEQYRNAIEKCKLKLGSQCIWVNFSSSSAIDSQQTLVSVEQSKLMLRLFLFNQEKLIYSFLDARTDSGLSLLNHDYDPTYLHYAVSAFNAVVDTKQAKDFAADVKIDSKKISYKSMGQTYICLSGKNLNDKPEYVNISLKQQDGKFFYIDPLTATCRQLSVLKQGGQIFLNNIRVPDYPVFIKIKEQK